MPNVIKIKSNGTAGTAPTSLEVGELALNRADGQLYYRNTSNNIAAITDTIDGGVVPSSASLLLHLDGANNSTTFTDSSPNNISVTATGNAKLSTAQAKFGTASLSVDGVNSYITAAYNANVLPTGTRDHTIELFCRPAATQSSGGLIATRIAGVYSNWEMHVTSALKVQVLVRRANASSVWAINQGSTTALTANAWNHVALVLQGGLLTLFINGVADASISQFNLTSAGGWDGTGSPPVYIGRGGDGLFNGHIDEVRIVNGTAVYPGTTSFTPATSEFPVSLGSSSRTQTIKLRGNTAANLSAANPTPAAREPVYETDTRLLKIGDGTTAYNSLGYVRPQVTATDRVLGRSSAGAGVAEEITCTADARAILAASNVYAARAWVNFNGTANTSLNGTYSQSGTTVTVTATAHGLAVGQSVYADITSGTGVDGLYAVATVPNANSFTYTAGTSLTTSGNVTLTRSTIRASGNVSSVSDNGVGDYAVNFASALADANYAAVVTIGGTSSALMVRTWEDSTARSASTIRIACVSVASGNPNIDPAQVSVVVFR